MVIDPHYESHRADHKKTRVSNDMNEESIMKLHQAEKLFFENKGERAKKIYTSLAGDSAEVAAFSMMRLGEIANQNGRAAFARSLFLRAFRAYPSLASLITPQEHLFHAYVYGGPVKEKRMAGCPLCGGKGVPYWSYIMVTNLDYQIRFNPVRTWKYCERCHHLYASAYPPYPAGQAREGKGVDNEYIKTAPALFPIYSDTLNQIKAFTAGRRLLDVGVGGGELVAVAREMGFDVRGIDISYSLAKRVHERFGVNVVCADFADYRPNEAFDIVCMGDVIEHMSDPKASVQKASELLNAGGVLWISTPNFESAFSKYSGHGDPMRRVAGHLSYFSYRSLEKVLTSAGFQLLNYQVSKHYNGSMEIIAGKL